MIESFGERARHAPPEQPASDVDLVYEAGVRRLALPCAAPMLESILPFGEWPFWCNRILKGTFCGGVTAATTPAFAVEWWATVSQTRPI
jgi:hypothetical protein